MANDGENRSNGQFSRFKARKVLGVGDRSGNGSVSKISQILGNVVSARREQNPVVIWWLRTLSFLMALSVITSMKGSTDLQSEIYAKLLTLCAFKLGISLALIYASFVAEEGAIQMAIVLVFGVFSFNAFASFIVMRLESTGILECGLNMFVLVCTYFVCCERKLWPTSDKLNS